jgi:HEAT repeats
MSDTNKSQNEHVQILKQLRRRSTDELIRIALGPSDEQGNPRWYTISALQHRETRKVFDAAKNLCMSDDPIKRTLGVDILAQLGLPVNTFLDETLEIFFNLIDTEQDIEVLHSVTVGLGHISPEPRKIKPLLKLKNHPNPEVRFGVAFGLCVEEDQLAIQALIELTSDEDSVVRDWATFGLGTQTDLDTPQIREALYQRVIDPVDKVGAAGEGLIGLVNRHDDRAFKLTLKHLQVSSPDYQILEAAEALADPRLYPALVKLRDDPEYDGFEKNYLEKAIAACKSQS